jgi:hypothetical protein
MADHKAKVVKYETAGDGLIVIHAECCEDADSHCQHATADLDNIEKEIADHLDRVAAQHERKQKAVATLQRLMQTP